MSQEQWVLILLIAQRIGAVLSAIAAAMWYCVPFRILGRVDNVLATLSRIEMLLRTERGGKNLDPTGERFD